MSSDPTREPDPQQVLRELGVGVSADEARAIDEAVAAQAAFTHQVVGELGDSTPAGSDADEAKRRAAWLSPVPTLSQGRSAGDAPGG
jgi:hypothetical protein